MKKITIDLLHGELALPMSVMYKEHKVLPNEYENIAAFVAKRFHHPDEEFFKSRLVKFHINEGKFIMLLLFALFCYVSNLKYLFNTLHRHSVDAAFGLRHFVVTAGHRK